MRNLLPNESDKTYNMNWLDILVLIPLCWWGFKGFRHGLIYEVFTILALILGFWAARHFSYLLQDWLKIPLAGTVAFTITFAIVLFFVHLVGRAMQKVVKIAIPEIIDHLLGLAFGVCKVVLVFSMFFYLLNRVDQHEMLIKNDIKEHSLAYKHIEPIVPEIILWKKELGNNTSSSES